MSLLVDQDQKWLIECLTATLDTSREVRSFAEASLQQASFQPGYGAALTKITINKDIPFGLRQLAAVLLKQFIKQHWQEGEENFIYPVVSAEEKVICLLPTLFLSYNIVHSCISVLGSMSGVYKVETAGLMLQLVNSLMDQFSIILLPPLQTEDPDEWSMRMEVLKCLLQLVQNFPSLAEAQFSITLSSLWQTFVSTLNVYQNSSINGNEDSHSGRFDSDGNERSLDAFVIQMFETLLTIVGNSKMAKVIGGSIKELVYYTIGYLQMTEEQAHTWSLDANQYVADEDDATYSCRLSGSLLLEELANAYGGEVIDSFIGAVKKRFSESHNLQVSGSANWWRLREACFFALVSIANQLIEEQNSVEAKVNLSYLLEEMISEDMRTDVHEFPFLHARVFSLVSKFSSVVSQTTRERFLYAAAQAIALDVPPPVKVSACKVLSQLLPESKSELVQPHITSVVSSLIDILKQASDETLHLVLETLQAAVRAGNELSKSMEPVISPIILDVWVHHVSDPFISIDALEVLEAIKDAPGCLEPLISRIIPFITSILEVPRNQPTGLLAGCFDLLTMILKNAPVEVIKAFFDSCFNSTIQVVLQSDDHSEMQNATECLSAFLAGGKHELLSWNGDSAFTMKRLLDAASRLLDPGLESSGSLFVGSYLLQLIFYFPLEMAFHLRDLVAAVVRRMQTCEIAGLKCSLIVVLARLVHFSSPNVSQFINLLLAVPAKDHENSLYYLMSEWTKLQGEIQGAYHIKVTTTALALLISTRHEEFEKVNVQGHLIKSNTGITTRSKAKIAPDQWSIIPLPTKIFSLLSDTLVEIQEQGWDDNNESDSESDWDDTSDILHQSKVPSKTNSAVDHLDAMAKVFNASDDENTEDELVKADPLNETKLAEFLTNFFINLHNMDRPLFDHLFQNLTYAQRIAVEKVISN